VVTVYKLLILLFLWFILEIIIVNYIKQDCLIVMLVVMFARVYYLCHYIMDTITGAIMGATVAFIVV